MSLSVSLGQSRCIFLASPQWFRSLPFAPGNLGSAFWDIWQLVNICLVPVSEDTDIIQIKGFAGKPEFAKGMR